MPHQTVLANELRARQGLLGDIEKSREPNTRSIGALCLALLRDTAHVSRSVDQASVSRGGSDVAGSMLLARSIERLACALADILSEVIRFDGDHANRPPLAADGWPDMIDVWNESFRIPSNMALDWRDEPQPLLTWRYALWGYVENLTSELSAVGDGRKPLDPDDQRAQRAVIETLAFALSGLTWLNNWAASLAR